MSSKLKARLDYSHVAVASIGETLHPDYFQSRIPPINDAVSSSHWWTMEPNLPHCDSHWRYKISLATLLSCLVTDDPTTQQIVLSYVVRVARVEWLDIIRFGWVQICLRFPIILFFLEWPSVMSDSSTSVMSPFQFPNLFNFLVRSKYFLKNFLHSFSVHFVVCRNGDICYPKHLLVFLQTKSIFHLQ